MKLLKSINQQLHPTSDRVLVQMDPDETESDGGIILPNGEQSVWGTIVRIGPDVQHVHLTERVCIPGHLGTLIKLAGTDVRYIVIREEQISLVEPIAS